jgi:hypothetical protein
LASMKRLAGGEIQSRMTLHEIVSFP